MPFMHGVNFLILRHKKWNLLFTMLCWGVDNPVLMVHANCLTGVNKFFESMSRMFHRLLRFATRNRENSHLPLLRLVGSSCGLTWLDFCCCGSPGYLLRMPAPECLLKRQQWLQFQLDLWKDWVSTEWLWPFLPDVYQSKRRWELSSYIFRNTVAGFVSIVQRRVAIGWRSCGCTRCAGAVGAAPFALPMVRSTPKLMKHWALSLEWLHPPALVFVVARYLKIRLRK